jgi:hypothetical protein
MAGFNKDNGIAIEGTEDFLGGPIYRPTGSSNGNMFSNLVNEFMNRIAVHDHSGESSKQLIQPVGKSYIVSEAFVADDDLFKVTTTLLGITSANKVLMFSYRLDADPEVESSWKKFYPEYYVDDVDPQELTIHGLIRDDMEIRITA